MLFQRVEAKTIYIAVSNPDMSFLSGGVAKFQGYFKDEGLDVEVLQMNANVSVAALAAGNVDYNLILQSVVTANLRGLPLKIAGISHRAAQPRRGGAFEHSEIRRPEK